MRKLKYHEQRLLRKVNLTEWHSTNTKREQEISYKYNLTDRDDYHKYNKLVGKIRKLALGLAKLKESDEFRNRIGRELVNMCHSLGFIKDKKLVSCSSITVSSVCNRRLNVILKRLKMVENIKDASTFIEHGHIKVGSRIVNKPGQLISTMMENFIKWCDSSKIKEKIDEFNEKNEIFDDL
ncbi:ribosomal S4 [Tubulinosema ratisbonensis]|uniref:Ribosomal S4 n=1 Tax=Tubulinosema ratisbonensis TaxID=291195 RepID=A0A437AP82_9MICR|nr:ribosomal S4 [Tubulinosema ratisbonensis]